MYLLPSPRDASHGLDLFTSVNFIKDSKTCRSNNNRKVQLMKFNTNKISFEGLVGKGLIVGEPKFVLSINGGFDSEGKFTECQRMILKQMISELIEKNETYIIGSGFKVGIYKLFGEIARHVKLLNFLKDFCVIGISSWKYLLNSENIIPGQTNYHEDDKFSSGKFPLDSICDLFLFSDEQGESYEEEISFRTSFEHHFKILVNKKLAQYQLETFWLQVVYGGNEGNLNLALRFLRNSDLILVIKGSGGIADLIATAMASDLTDIESLCFMETPKTKDCLQEMRKNYKSEIIVYDLHDSSIGINERITAVISARKMNLYRKVLFSSIFNQVSIDECEFSKISDLKEIKNILKIFLELNCFQILKTLLPKIENLERIFQEKDLLDLYNSSIKSEVGFQKYLSHGWNQLLKNSDELRRSFYFNDEGIETLQMEPINNPNANSNYITSKKLFLWALTSNFHEMGKVIWENANEPLPLAFFGAIMLNKMANEYKQSGFITLSEKYIKESQYYQNISKEIVMEAYEKDNKVAVQILLKPRSVHESKSLLQIVIREKFVTFCNQSACQHFLNITWKNGNLSDPGQANKKISWKRRIQSPESKYYLHLLSYIIFLLLFTYFNLIELDIFNIRNTKRVACEFTIYAFIIGFIFEEIMEFFCENNYGKSSNIYNYMKGLGNQFDVATLFVSVMSVTLRWTITDDKFMIIRCFFSITLSMFYAKAMYFYLYNLTFGHKVIMIKRMIMDTLFFLAIFLVFLFAYGTLLQSLQYPNSHFGLVLLKDIFYRPYFQVYGELMLDSFPTPEVCNTSSCILRNSTITIGFAIFLLLTNILLLNLLIAMFNYTFQQDVENRYSFLSVLLLQEYYNKSIFPSPLICLYFPNWVCRCLYQRCITDPIDNENEMFPSILVKGYDENETKRIYAFEKWCAVSVLRRKESDSRRLLEIEAY